MRRPRSPCWLLALALLPDIAGADDSSGLHAIYNLDIAAVEGRSLEVLDKLLVDGSTQPRPGLTLYGSLMLVNGDRPNLAVGSLQGVDSIEVARHRLKLYEAWVEQEVDGVSVRAGLYDLNSEFYATASSDLLVNPSFGIGPEMAASGVNGPSIFPSTALTVRVRYEAKNKTYLQVAAINAIAGTLGDPGGINTGFGEGLLVVAEGGWTGRGKLALGAWRYTQRQLVEPAGPDPTARAAAQGAYALIEQPLGGSGTPITAFLRVGAADPASDPFTGSAQAGIFVTPVVGGRPDSQFSAAVAYAKVGARSRAALSAQGARPAHAETALELTYADKIGKHLTVQPDLQFVRHAGAERGRNETLFILRLTLDY